MNYPAGRIRWYLGACIWHLRHIPHAVYEFGRIFNWLCQKMIVWSGRVRGTHKLPVGWPSATWPDPLGKSPLEPDTGPPEEDSALPAPQHHPPVKIP